ncbi:MAG: hypothetical protein FJ112_04980 [Deltaproteobacteria bacterium]|nr:hypothetical protein [Deltaproteobacteria bacterium]
MCYTALIIGALVTKSRLGCELSRHFNFSLKRGLGAGCGVGFGLVAILAALWVGRVFPPTNAEEESLFARPLKKSELSCGQVIQLAKWGQKRYGGLGSKDLFHPKRAAKVAEIFVEKIDPHRMLFLAQEVEQLKVVSQSRWEEFVENSNCDLWQQWLEQNYPKVQQRVSYQIRKRSSDKRNKTIEKEKRFTRFSASMAELEKRWKEELGRMAFEANEEILKAYQGNRLKFLKDRSEQKYFEGTPEASNLLAKALLGGLDTYSTYFSPSEFEDFYEELKGSTAGLGLRLQKVPQGFLIEKIIDNSSAKKSRALHEGDIIEKVEGIELSSISFEEAKKLLKGPEKSLVNLGVYCSHRSPSKTFVDLVLERTQFDLEETKMAFNWKSPKTEPAKKVAVISIPTFYGRGGLESGVEEKSVSEDFKSRLEQELLKETSHAGLVLDLRGNPGGYLEEAVSLGALFVGNKPIVGILEEGKTRILKDNTAVQPLYHRPTVVLVDEDSASAAEVLTGALKDYQRAVVVGSSRTYGKGTVQKLFPLEDPFLLSPFYGENLGAGVVKLTTSVFYSPLGHTPANGGIETDIVVKDGNSGDPLAKNTQEILPIVDQELKKELENRLTQHHQNIELLRAKSRERLDSEPSLVEDKDLEEAIAIVSDLAQLNTF